MCVVTENQVRSSPFLLTPLTSWFQSHSKICRLAKSLFNSSKFKVIENPTKFQTSYQNKLSQEKRSVIEKGVYDVSVVRAPSFKGNSLICYVEKKNTPYKVIVNFSKSGKEPQIKYELLPYADRSY